MTGRAQRAPELLLEQAMSEPRPVPLEVGRLVCFSCPCPGRSAVNEDGIALVPIGTEAAVLAVADGVGGHSGGEVAARTALGCLVEALAEASPGALRGAILDGLERANERVIALATGAATTLSIVEIYQGTCRPYHVGDSLILLTGGRGRIKHQNIAHSPVGYGVEAGLLDEEGSLHHADRHLVSNFVGSPGMRIEIGAPLRLAPRDTLVLASDGLADNLLVSEIVERVRRGGIDKAGRLLADDALRAMTKPEAGRPSKPDDLTFILFRPHHIPSRAGGRAR